MLIGIEREWRYHTSSWVALIGRSPPLHPARDRIAWPWFADDGTAISIAPDHQHQDCLDVSYPFVIDQNGRMRMIAAAYNPKQRQDHCRRIPCSTPTNTTIAAV
jgi:hypothetical protein